MARASPSFPSRRATLLFTPGTGEALRVYRLSEAVEPLEEFPSWSDQEPFRIMRVENRLRRDNILSGPSGPQVRKRARQTGQWRRGPRLSRGRACGAQTEPGVVAGLARAQASQRIPA